MIHVIAIITAKPGLRDKILTHFQNNVPACRAEDGCIEYGSAIDADSAPSFQSRWGEDTFLVIEKWASVEALEAHAVSPHMKEYAAKVKDMIATRAVYVLSPVSKMGNNDGIS